MFQGMNSFLPILSAFLLLIGVSACSINSEIAQSRNIQSYKDCGPAAPIPDLMKYFEFEHLHAGTVLHLQGEFKSLPADDKRKNREGKTIPKEGFDRIVFYEKEYYFNQLPKSKLVKGWDDHNREGFVKRPFFYPGETLEDAPHTCEIVFKKRMFDEIVLPKPYLMYASTVTTFKNSNEVIIPIDQVDPEIERLGVDYIKCNAHLVKGAKENRVSYTQAFQSGFYNLKFWPAVRGIKYHDDGRLPFTPEWGGNPFEQCPKQNRICRIINMLDDSGKQTEDWQVVYYDKYDNYGFYCLSRIKSRGPGFINDLIASPYRKAMKLAKQLDKDNICTYDDKNIIFSNLSDLGVLRPEEAKDRMYETCP